MSAAARRGLGALLAALVVGGAMAVIAVAGDEPGPPADRAAIDLPTLAEAPLPGASGEVALLADGAVRCAMVVDVADGEARELRCERDLAADRPRWTATGDVEVRRHDADGIEVLVLDATDGTVRHRRLIGQRVDRAADDAQLAPRRARDGRRLVTGADGERTWVDVVGPSGATERLVEVPTTRWWGFTAAAWSPDERLVLVESHEAVYLVDVASGEARTLMAGARLAAWRPQDLGLPER